MVVLLALATVDFLLPAVQVPLFAWLLVILIWICGKAVNEAKKVPAPKKEILLPTISPVTWLQSTEHTDTYATPDDLWAIVAGPKGEFWLWGEGDQHVNLSHARGLGEAMDLAEVVIYATTPKEK